LDMVKTMRRMLTLLWMHLQTMCLW